jgi:hypothetical protein
LESAFIDDNQRFGSSIGKDLIAFAAPALRIGIAPAPANVLFLSV